MLRRTLFSIKDVDTVFPLSDPMSYQPILLINYLIPISKTVKDLLATIPEAIWFPPSSNIALPPI